ncbi:hypothetical protein FIU90_14425 [Erythrobacter sp. THAF29]|nr:hypothetical protein FIU90_14425 [Erythrobacter sp. THAF29]
MSGERSDSVDTDSNRILSDEERLLFRIMSGGGSLRAIKKSTGLSSKKVRAIVGSARLVLAANDTAVDDFLDMVNKWPVNDQDGLFFAQDKVSESRAEYLVRPTRDDTKVSDENDHLDRRQEIIAEIEREWSPFEMRDLGGSLIRLADALDQNWDPANVQAAFHWPSAAAQIERNSIELAKKATLLKRQNSMRKKFLPEAMLGEPTWNMLLELFCQFAGGAMVSSKSLCIAADCPETTAQRYIDRLEECGLVERAKSSTDRRVTMIKLTKKGVVGVGRVLERMLV